MASEAEVLVIRSPPPVAPDALLAVDDFYFMNRSTAERHSAVRQVIPYIIVMSAACVLGYRRSLLGTEERLIGELSIGWGGHIEAVDRGAGERQPSMYDLISNCAVREIREELSLEPPLVRTQLGLIIDDSPVGRFHVGWLEVWAYPETISTVAHDTASEVFWLNLSQLEELEDGLEPWSRTAAARLRGYLRQTQPTLGESLT